MRLPAALYNTWDLALERESAEAQAADAELAEERAGATAELATVVLAALELWLLGVFYGFCCGRHAFLNSDSRVRAMRGTACRSA